MCCFVFHNHHSVTPLVVSDFWYRVHILFNFLDAVIVLVVEDEKGEEVVVLPYTRGQERGESGGYILNGRLVVSTNKSGFSGWQIKAFY